MATTTPLPAARPSAFKTMGAVRASTCRWAAAALSNSVKAADGTPWRAMNSLEKILLPSSRAAAFEGPNTARPASRKRSASPSTSGPSGPTSVRSTASRRASVRSPSTSFALTSGKLRPTSAVPGLPGAIKTSVTCGLCFNDQASACSRAAAPTISTFMTFSSAPALPAASP
jgi:hypothetical protein